MASFPEELIGMVQKIRVDVFLRILLFHRGVEICLFVVVFDWLNVAAMRCISFLLLLWNANFMCPCSDAVWRIANYGIKYWSTSNHRVVNVLNPEVRMRKTVVSEIRQDVKLLDFVKPSNIIFGFATDTIPLDDSNVKVTSKNISSEVL